MVPPDSRRIARVLRYSGAHYVAALSVYRAVTFYGRPFQVVPLKVRVRYRESYNPNGLTTPGLASSPFARRY